MMVSIILPLLFLWYLSFFYSKQASLYGRLLAYKPTLL